MNSPHLFFIQVPPGLEALSQKELELKAPKVLIKKNIEGGIEIECPLHEGLFLNLILKIPNRILLRLDSFKCRDLPKLFNKMRKIKWSEYLSFQDIEVKASSHESRLFHSKKIEQTAYEAIQKFFQGQPVKEKYKTFFEKRTVKQSVYIRLDHDQCQISLDTSGERLGYRGYRSNLGRAPLRENLAAALYFQAFLDQTKSANFLDPFCGSGTLLFESTLFWQQNTSREYGFQSFTPFLDHKLPSSPYSVDTYTPPYNTLSFLGFDYSDNQLSQAVKNLDHLKQEDLPIRLEKRDSIKNPYSQKADILITNPPYNKRIPAHQDLKGLLELLEQKYDIDTFYVLFPITEEAFFKMNKKLTLNWSIILKFKNGGIPVCLLRASK